MSEGLNEGTRLEKVRKVGWRLLGSVGERISHTYFIKNVKYGACIDCYDYNKVQVAFKSKRISYEKNSKGIKSDFSVSRAREKVYQIAEANRGRFGRHKEVFFTLTTQDQLKDHKESNKKIKAFARRLSKHVGYSVKYLIVPELHKSGALHYHGLFFNLPFIDIKFFRYQLWKFGTVDLQVPKNIKNTSAYIAKYLTKDFQEKTPKNTKLYFTARGMFRPTTEFTTDHPTGRLKVREIMIARNYQKIRYIDQDVKIQIYKGSKRDKRKRV